MKRILLLLAVLILCVSPAWAQIAFDNADLQFFGTAASSFTLSYTCTGSDRGLYVTVHVSVFQGSGHSITGVTYNSVSMTEEAMTNRISGEWEIITGIYSLEAPATGANDIVASTAGGNVGALIGAISLTGVDQTDSVEAVASAQGTSTTPSVNIITLTANAWAVDGAGESGDETTHTAGSGQTRRWNHGVEGDFGGGAGSTEGPVVTPGSVTMDWTFANVIWNIHALAIKPASAAARRLGVIR